MYTFFLIRKPSICLSLNFLNFSRSWAWDFLKFFLTFTEILAKMVYTFVINIVYLNLNSILNVLNAITTKHRFLANKNTNFWKLSLVIFLGFWPFEPHFLINFFLIKRGVSLHKVSLVSNPLISRTCHLCVATLRERLVARELFTFAHFATQKFDVRESLSFWRCVKFRLLVTGSKGKGEQGLQFVSASYQNNKQSEALFLCAKTRSCVLKFVRVFIR